MLPSLCAAFCEDEILFFTFEILFCCWQVLWFLFKVEQTLGWKCVFEKTLMSRVHEQGDSNVTELRSTSQGSATFCPLKLWIPFCLYEYFREFIPGLQWTLFLVWWISCFVWDFDIAFCWVYSNMNNNMLCMMWWPVMPLILPTLPEWCDVITFLCFWGHHILYVILWKIF